VKNLPRDKGKLNRFSLNQEIFILMLRVRSLRALVRFMRNIMFSSSAMVFVKI